MFFTQLNPWNLWYTLVYLLTNVKSYDLVGWQPPKFPLLKSETGFSGSRKKEAHHPTARLVSGGFNNQENLLKRPVFLGVDSGEVDLRRGRQNPKVYEETLTGLSDVYHPRGLHSTLLSQGCLLEMAPAPGKESGTIIQVPGRDGIPPVIGSSWGKSPGITPSYDLLQHIRNVT